VIGVLRIHSFGEGVPEAVQQVLTQGRNRGARAWIVDLRGNTGGSIEAMLGVAANFVEGRPVGLAVDRSGTPTPTTTAGRPAIPRKPKVFLVDRETASGAEVLAAAIKEYGIAPLVGTRTAGSVGVAAPRPLSDGSAVQITIGRLVAPYGAQLDKVGVQPDYEVERTVADLERGEDPQLLRAAEVLVGGGGLPTGR
jgi:carboxyl-terminal processing protease